MKSNDKTSQQQRPFLPAKAIKEE